jgi:hypothetical protein
MYISYQAPFTNITRGFAVYAGSASSLQAKVAQSQADIKKLLDSLQVAAFARIFFCCYAAPIRVCVELQQSDGQASWNLQTILAPSNS